MSSLYDRVARGGTVQHRQKFALVSHRYCHPTWFSCSEIGIRMVEAFENPTPPPAPGPRTLARGGCCSSDRQKAGSPYSDSCPTNYRNHRIGIRLVEVFDE